MTKMNTQEHYASAEKIVQLFVQKKLTHIDVPYNQLDTWYRLNDDSSIQHRLERLNLDSVKRIVSLIEFYGDLRYANPVLIYYDKKKKKYILVNGNHTTAAIVEAVEKGYIKLSNFNGQQIPEELLPNNDYDRNCILEWIAILMNRDPQPKTRTTRKDIRRTALSAINRDGILAVNEPQYIATLAEAYQVGIKEIQKIISEAIADVENEKNETDFNFYAWPEHRIGMIEARRAEELSTKHKTVHCTRAVVGDKTYESLGKAVGLAINYSQAHIVFHFSSYTNVSLRTKLESDISEWMKFCSKPITYEFLPYKSTEIDKFCSDNGILFPKKYSKKH